MPPMKDMRCEAACIGLADAFASLASQTHSHMSAATRRKTRILALSLKLSDAIKAAASRRPWWKGIPPKVKSRKGVA